MLIQATIKYISVFLYFNTKSIILDIVLYFAFHLTMYLVSLFLSKVRDFLHSFMRLATTIGSILIRRTLEKQVGFEEWGQLYVRK